MESIKYKIRLNEWPNDEFIDSFYIQVEDENKCQNCNVLSAISLTDKGHISFDGSVIKIEVYE